MERAPQSGQSARACILKVVIAVTKEFLIEMPCALWSRSTSKVLFYVFLDSRMWPLCLLDWLGYWVPKEMLFDLTVLKRESFVVQVLLEMKGFRPLVFLLELVWQGSSSFENGSVSSKRTASQVKFNLSSKSVWQNNFFYFFLNEGKPSNVYSKPTYLTCVQPYSQYWVAPSMVLVFLIHVRRQVFLVRSIVLHAVCNQWSYCV